jgi:hypothetical protein
MDQFYRDALNKLLDLEYIPKLPPLSRQPDASKQRSRGLCAFGMAHFFKISPEVACSQVVDDYDDFGIDGFHWNSEEETLYLVQCKHQPDEELGINEIGNFGNGIAKIASKDFANLNALFRAHLSTIDTALEQCRSIQPVVVTSGGGVSRHGKDAYYRWHSPQDPRIANQISVLNGADIVEAMLNAQGYEKVNSRVHVKTQVRLTTEEHALVAKGCLLEWAKLLEDAGVALFAKNIRQGLGQKSEVNQLILDTIRNNPEEFFLLNNGITVIAVEATPRQTTNGFTGYDLKGISVVNGAQTLTTALEAKRNGLEEQLSRAFITITLVMVGNDEELAQQITKARNHQNAVNRTDFSALDPNQEDLRRKFALLGIQYIIKAMDASLIPSGAIWPVDVSIVSNYWEKDPMAARNAKQARYIFQTTTTEEYKIAFDNPKGPYLLYILCYSIISC